MRILVAGAGGFVGGHLVKDLIKQGHNVRAVDIKPLADWFQISREADSWRLDLAKLDHCQKAVRDMDHVYNLAASMGGMGYIESHKADCMLNVLIDAHLLLACSNSDVTRYFFSSSACVYNAERQRSTSSVVPLVEADAYPAMPEDGYGWSKLFSERMCRHFTEDYGITTRVARLHNVYGPHGSWNGGREKAPAAIMRKVIQAKMRADDTIEIWGNGQQRRSFMFIDDCIHGINLIMNGKHPSPINLGSNEVVSINQLVDIAEEIAGVRLNRSYDLNAPKGVNGRNSDNTLIKRLFNGWEPHTPLRAGMKQLHDWLYREIKP